MLDEDNAVDIPSMKHFSQDRHDISENNVMPSLSRFRGAMLMFKRYSPSFPQSTRIGTGHGEMETPTSLKNG